MTSWLCFQTWPFLKIFFLSFLRDEAILSAVVNCRQYCPNLLLKWACSTDLEGRPGGLLSMFTCMCHAAHKAHMDVGSHITYDLRPQLSGLAYTFKSIIRLQSRSQPGPAWKLANENECRKALPKDYWSGLVEVCLHGRETAALLGEDANV